MSNIISRNKAAEGQEGGSNSHSPPQSAPRSPTHSPTHSPIPEDAPPTQSQFTPRTATPLKSAMATHGSTKKKRVTISPHTSNCIDDDAALPPSLQNSTENSDSQDLADEDSVEEGEGEGEDPLQACAEEGSPPATSELKEPVAEENADESGNGAGIVEGGTTDADEGLGGEEGQKLSSVAGEEGGGGQQDRERGSMEGVDTSTLDQQEGALDKMSENAVGSSPTGRFLKFDIEVGRGSFKTVYRGLDTETGVAVAWCELSTHKMTKNDRARFMEEGKMLKILEHRNILGFYDYWEVPEKRKVILVTELMTSGTLKAYMRRLKDVKIKFIRTWGGQILQGLHYLHTCQPPIIHRDLKCDNIFINGTTGLVKIGDLGLATLKVSHVKTVIGTPEFMAPEMYEEHYDESVDVYAFGMCLVEMSTLEYPYQECSNPAQVYKKVTAGVPPQSLERMKNPTVKDIVLKCTKQHKEDRYTVQELLENRFFQLADYKIEVLPPDDPLDKGSNIISLRIEPQRLHLPDMEEDSATAFECTFDLQSDVPDDIAKDLVLQGIISSEDTAEVSKLIEKKVAQKREQEGEPVAVAQQQATEEREAPVEPVSITPPHIGRQESGSALAAHSQQESPVVGKTDDTAVSQGEESQFHSPPLDEATVDPLGGESLDPTPPCSAPPSSSSSPDNPPNTAAEAQQGPALQPPPPLTSQLSEGQEELATSRSSSKLAKVVPQAQEEGSGAVEKHKKQRGRAPARVGKEGKRPLKLLLSSVQRGDLAECQFTSFGQHVKFTFSLQADAPDLLAENLMQAGHLQRDQKDEFCSLARSVIQQAKEQVQRETQASSTESLSVLVEQDMSERQEVEETFTAVDSSAALVQALDKSDAGPCEPEQASVARKEGSGSSSPAPPEHAIVVDHVTAKKEAEASKENMSVSKEALSSRAGGTPSEEESALLPESEAGAREERTVPKESRTPPKEDRTPPSDGVAKSKEGGTPPKEGGTPPKEGGAAPKEGGAAPKELQVPHNFSAPLMSAQNSTDSSAVSSPSEPFKTVGESTAESELALSVHPRPPVSAVRGLASDSSHPSSSAHVVDSPAVVPVTVSAAPSSLAHPIIPSTSAPYPGSTALPLDDTLLHQRMSSELFPGVLPPSHPSPYYPHHTWMGPTYHPSYPPTPWSSYIGGYQPQHTLPLPLPPGPLPQAPLPQPVRPPHRVSLPTGVPSAKTFVVETVAEPSSFQPLGKEKATKPSRPFVVESIAESELEGTQLLTAGAESRMDSVLASMGKCQLPEEDKLPATCEDRLPVSPPEADLGHALQKEALPFDPKELQVMDGALGMMLYSMLQVLRNPRMNQLVSELERRYSGSSTAHSSGRQSPETNHSTSYHPLFQDEGVPAQADQELEALKRQMAEERQKLEKMQEERLQEYTRRRASVPISSAVGPSDKRASSPLLSRSERHLKPALEEVSRQTQLQAGPHTLQPLAAPASRPRLPYFASQDTLRPPLSHISPALGAAQYHAFPQGGGMMLQEGATEGIPPQLPPHPRLPPSAGMSWGGTPSYPIPPQQSGAPHAAWPTDQHSGAPLTAWHTDQQHSGAPHAAWPTDQQHSGAPHAAWPNDQHSGAPHAAWHTDQQHSGAPHAAWPTDQQHSGAPHAAWPTDQHSGAPHAAWHTDQQHSGAPHAAWPTDQQHSGAPHAAWPTDQQHSGAPHAAWPTDQQHSGAPHAAWPTDHYPLVPGKQ